MCVDLSAHRLELAQTLGADFIVNMSEEPTSSMEECGERIRAMISRVDSTIECSGADSSVSLGIHVSYVRAGH